MAKEALESASAMQGTFVRMGAGAVGLLLFGLFTRRLGEWVGSCRDARLAGSFLVAVCVVTFGGFWLSLVAIKHLPVAVANTLISLEPVFVLPLAAIVLKEKITSLQIVGTLTALGGVIVLCNA